MAKSLTYNYGITVMGEKVTFESTAHNIELDGQSMVGVWIDGVMLPSDNGNLVAGKKYKVIVEEIE
jgi:hypothetical protein